MATITLELPSQDSIAEHNMSRWEELVADPKLAAIPERIETDRFGRIIMSPPPSAQHGSLQFRIGALLSQLMLSGRVITECPISTADGVKAADVAWASPMRIAELGKKVCFPHAPEICVEIISPGNSRAEIEEKTSLYFDAGALEVWHCSPDGRMTFFPAKAGRPLRSDLCAVFPVQITL